MGGGFPSYYRWGEGFPSIDGGRGLIAQLECAVYPSLVIFVVLINTFVHARQSGKQLVCRLVLVTTVCVCVCVCVWGGSHYCVLWWLLGHGLWLEVYSAKVKVNHVILRYIISMTLLY